MSDDFYVRLYIGHRGKFGHEFLEIEFRPDGKLRYANNSNYKNDTMIRKEMYVSPIVLNELKRIVEDSEVSSMVQHCDSSEATLLAIYSLIRPLVRAFSPSAFPFSTLILKMFSSLSPGHERR